MNPSTDQLSSDLGLGEVGEPSKEDFKEPGTGDPAAELSLSNSFADCCGAGMRHVANLGWLFYSEKEKRWVEDQKLTSIRSRDGTSALWRGGLSRYPTRHIGN